MSAFRADDRYRQCGVPAHQKIISPVSHGGAGILAQLSKDPMFFLHGGYGGERTDRHRKICAYLGGSAMSIRRQHVDINFFRKAPEPFPDRLRDFSVQ